MMLYHGAGKKQVKKSVLCARGIMFICITMGNFKPVFILALAVHALSLSQHIFISMVKKLATPSGPGASVLVYETV